jgi:hypothetical protein
MQPTEHITTQVLQFVAEYVETFQIAQIPKRAR